MQLLENNTNSRIFLNTIIPTMKQGGVGVMIWGYASSVATRKLVRVKARWMELNPGKGCKTDWGRRFSFQQDNYKVPI